MMTKKATTPRTAIRCTQCGEQFKSNRAFEAHAEACTGGGKHKPLGEMTTEELMAMYEAQQKGTGQ